MRRFERAGLAAALTALIAGGFLAACSNTVSGTAEVNQTELQLYTSEIKSSSAAASSSRAAAAAAAATDVCEALRDHNNPAVDAFNAYIDASDNNAPDVEAKKGAAITALRDTAGKIDEELSPDVPNDVSAPMRTYRDNLKTLADLLERNASVDEINGEIDSFNGDKDAAFDACEAY
ncbi:hypothetical protein IU448_16410 [Nocardia flavorosea]|uniref:hypothetical protein n=1 Tax=Nocardia flavorosea TaxID=53429 RepID=UPI00189399BB|nr:hypothetical protein [Nocardia flavorosea]MBF6350585.1 hypothetical protein [Nocardia flavorosea]